ncbi:MAG TPA: protein kinase [Blastocatellia bacterium]|nr:protein kinase [Blastocatellia bacterium]
MTPERWQQIEPIYHGALECLPDERATFLQQSCTGDEELRREIESLLASHDQAASFIEKPPADIAAGMIAEKHSVIGRTLGHYTIQSKIGAGGMGEVYRAHDTRLDRDVAVKILPEHLAQDAEALRRFEREAKAVAALSHPNILAIHDFGNEQGVSYAVMELLEGETLRARIQRGAIGWREVAEIGVAIAEGLSAAHSKNIIHRDLKPENIFLTTSGVKILDFGIARVKRPVLPDAETLATAIETTKHGVVMGSIGYMSPEQVKGELADAPSDIFSLGCVLYEMLSGQRPFARESTAEVIAAILDAEPPLLTNTHGKLPAELSRVIGHCLPKKPDNRYQSARDLSLDLKAMLAGKPVTAQLPWLPARRSRLAIRIGVVILAVLLTTMAWLFWWNKPVGAIDSLAILPLANASGDPNLEYLSDGITESLINSLSQLPQLRVMARGTVFSYKGKEVDPRKVGEELKVRAVFTGKMVQRGDTLNIQADLVNAYDGSQIWGDRYTRKLADAQSILEEIARQISEKLRLKLSGAEQQRVTKRQTENPEAYQLYLKGRYYSNQFTTEDLKKGIELMNRAVEADPTYALAHAGLSASYYNASNFIFPPDEAMPKVKAAAQRAIELDDTIAEAHVSLGLVQERFELNRVEAAKEFKRALELAPNSERAQLYYGLNMIEEGRVDEAIAAMTRARDLDPLTLFNGSTLAWGYYLARRNDEAIAQLQKMIGMEPNFFVARFTLGLAYEQKGMYEQAIAEFNEAQRIDPESWVPSAFLAQVYAIKGNRAEVQRRLEELKRNALQKHVDSYNIGVIHAALGEKDQAFEWLEKAFQAKSEELMFIKVDPRIDSLRSDARYADLLRRLKLAP